MPKYIPVSKPRIAYLGLVLLCLCTGIAMVAQRPADKTFFQAVTQQSSRAVIENGHKQDSALTTATVQPTTHKTTADNQKPVPSKTNTNGSVKADNTAHTTTVPVPPQTLTVILQINDIRKGTITLVAGSTQCDVLSTALADGTISSLTMRYNPQYKTNAVYVINGQGDNETVWWAYKVNGKSPPYGCSNMLAHDGDTVNWEDIRS